jgi:CheY-like chemotaxis protein
MKKLNCILLVDDYDADNYYNNFILKDASVSNHVNIALNGVEALEYLRKSGEYDHNGLFPRPELIFLDINMPLMNGFEFLEKFKMFDVSFKSSTRIIILTTSLNPDDRARALQINEVKDFINKPLTIELIHQLIAKHF